MYEVHIYIAMDNVSPREAKRNYGYVLECMTSKGIATREGFGSVRGTYNKAILYAMIQAMSRLNQSCELHIHAENSYVMNMLEHQLSKWAGADFKNKKGEPVANAEEWMQVWQITKKQFITAEPGRHAYSEWIREEMRKREAANRD